MNKAELEEKIARVSDEEAEKKDILESSFTRYKKQMMPGEIAKRFLKKGVMKVKSFLPHVNSGSTPKHERIRN